MHFANVGFAGLSGEVLRTKYLWFWDIFTIKILESIECKAISLSHFIIPRPHVSRYQIMTGNMHRHILANPELAQGLLGRI